MSTTTPAGGFSLFPSTARPPSRTQALRSRAPTPQHQLDAGRATPDPTASSLQPPEVVEAFRQHIGEAVTADGRVPAPSPATAGTASAAAAAAADAVRSSSVRSRSSIAKVRLSFYDDSPPPLDDPPPPMPGQAADAVEYQYQQQQQQQQPQPPLASQMHRPPALRSIFPQYNPELPLDQQEYFPTQTSPTRIPRAIISRPLYSPGSPDRAQPTSPSPQPQPQPQLQPQVQPQPQSARTQSQSRRPRLSLETVVTAPVQPASHMYASTREPAPATAAAGVAGAAASRPWPTSAGAAAVAAVARSGGLQAPKLPVPSSSEELCSFWKVANGWKAGPSEGRVYCMRMSCDRDAPVYRLSSASHQPFYRLRLDPTSMSAYVTLSRHDPARPFKMDTSKNGNSSGGGGGGGGGGENAAGDDGDRSRSASSCASMLDIPSGGSVRGGSSSILGGGSGGAPAVAATPNPYARFDGSKNWQVAMTTTLEEEARRHQPQDGLVALLYPSAATRMALERPHDLAMVMTAERECARLVWDDDSGCFFLVHPALALPFCVAIERSTTWSRTAYTLEHRESPQHLARLTRDGTGAGYLEVDTAIAAKIDAVYLVDVVVAALVLVAHSDGEFRQAEQFAPPPLQPPPAALLAGGSGGVDGGSGSGGAGSGDGGGAASAHASLLSLVLGGGARSVSRMSAASRHSAAAPSRGRLFGGRSKKLAARRTRMDEFDPDLESQTSIDLSSKMFEMGPVGAGDGTAHGGGLPGASQKKGRRRRSAKQKDKDKMPGCLRLITVLFKCCFWCVAMCVRAMLAILRVLFRCITSEKL